MHGCRRTGSRSLPFQWWLPWQMRCGWISSMLTKTFPGVKALSDMSLRIRPGEVHALLGENGAGKSTLLRTMSGVMKPNSGTISVDGEALTIRGPLDARRAGIAMIHQELQQVPELTVAQNMFLGRSLRRGRRFRRSRGARESGGRGARGSRPRHPSGRARSNRSKSRSDRSSRSVGRCSRTPASSPWMSRHRA